MPNNSNKPSKVRLTGAAREERLTVLKSARKFKELNLWYAKEARRMGLTTAKIAHGVGAEIQIFILKKLKLEEQAKKRAIELITEDGRNMVLMVEANARIPYKKADFIARIDHALKILPDVKEALIKEVPHGKEIIKGLPGVREKLASDPRTTSVGGAGIMQDISLINLLKLQQILGKEKFSELTRLTAQTMDEVRKRGY